MNILSPLKVSALAFALMLAGSLSAASVTWFAGGFAKEEFATSGVSGTAYLIGAPSGVTDTQIANYLHSYGTSYDGDDYTLVGKTDLSSAKNIGGEDGVSFLNTNLTEGTNYFTLILLEDGETFILSDLRTGSGINGPEPGDDDMAWTIKFPAMSFDPSVPATTWKSGTLGGGPVPEPTALALLALGVAGVALRRRV